MNQTNAIVIFSHVIMYLNIFTGERDDNNEIVIAKKKVVREAFGSGSDSDGSVNQEEGRKTSKIKRSGSEGRSRSAHSSDSEGKYFELRLMPHYAVFIVTS